MKIISKKEALLEHVSIESMGENEVSLIVSNKMAEMNLKSLQAVVEKSFSTILGKEV